MAPAGLGIGAVGCLSTDTDAWADAYPHRYGHTDIHPCPHIHSDAHSDAYSRGYGHPHALRGGDAGRIVAHLGGRDPRDPDTLST